MKRQIIPVPWLYPRCLPSSRGCTFWRSRRTASGTGAALPAPELTAGQSSAKGVVVCAVVPGRGGCTLLLAEAAGQPRQPTASCPRLPAPTCRLPPAAAGQEVRAQDSRTGGSKFKFQVGQCCRTGAGTTVAGSRHSHGPHRPIESRWRAPRGAPLMIRTARYCVAAGSSEMELWPRNTPGRRLVTDASRHLHAEAV